MKLFTKQIDDKLFAQYPLGNDLESQVVVAKIFNPYGKGTWYLLNSDPEDPDYIWAIVDFHELEIGSVSRASLENTIIGPFKLNLERDLSFEPINAAELFNKLRQGHRHFKNGGGIYDKGGRIAKGEKVVPNPEFFKGHTGKYKHIFGIVTEMPYENEQGVVVVKFETIQGGFEEQTFMEETLKRYVTNDHKQFAGGGSVSDARYIRPEEIIAVYLKNGKVFRNGYSTSDHVPMFSGLLVSDKPVTKDENTDQMALFKPGGKLDKKHLPKTAKYIKRSEIEKVEVGIYEDESDETIKGSHLFSGIWFDDEENVRRYERAKAEGRFGNVKKAKAPKKAKGEVFAGGGGIDDEIYYGVVDANDKLVFQSKNEREAKQVSWSYEGSIVKKYKGKGKIHKYAGGGGVDEFPFEHKGYKYNVENTGGAVNDRGQALFKVSIQEHGEYTERAANLDLAKQYARAEINKIIEENAFAKGGGVGSEQVWKHKHMNMTAVILGTTAKGYKVQTTDYTFKKPKVKIEYFHKQDFDDKGRALFEKKFENGAMIGAGEDDADLFEDYDSLPKNVQEVLGKYSDEDPTYESLEQMLSELEPLGYTFEYDLDAVPYNLHKIYSTGGGVGEISNGYRGLDPNEVWNSWTTGQRRHFMEDHLGKYAETYPIDSTIAKNWDEIDEDEREMVVEHVKRGQYKNGGKIEKVMHEFKAGKLHSGSKKGPIVKSRKQAIAIALSEAGMSKTGTANTHSDAVGMLYLVAGNYTKKLKIGGNQKLQKIVGKDIFYKSSDGKKWFWANAVIQKMSVSELNALTKKIQDKMPEEKGWKHKRKA